MQVAFIGISNWALDPAKMNRGILVQRDVPDEEELIETARWCLWHSLDCSMLYHCLCLSHLHWLGDVCDTI